MTLLGKEEGYCDYSQLEVIACVLFSLKNLAKKEKLKMLLIFNWRNSKRKGNRKMARDLYMFQVGSQKM